MPSSKLSIADEVEAAITRLRQSFRESVDEIAKSIAAGFPQTGMPAWSATLDDVKIRRLAISISEKRSDFTYTDFKVAAPPVVPAGSIKSEEHSFRIETVTTGLDRLPFSIAPLPDGRILVTEKTRGLRIVSPDGTLSELIRGTPHPFDDGFEMPGLRIVYGLGFAFLRPRTASAERRLQAFVRAALATRSRTS